MLQYELCYVGETSVEESIQHGTKHQINFFEVQYEHHSCEEKIPVDL